MSLSELVRMLADFAEIAVTILVAYVVYKIAGLIDSLDAKIRGDKTA